MKPKVYPQSAACNLDPMSAVTGVFQLTVRHAETNEIVLSLRRQNLIVSNFRTQILHLFGGDDIADRYIDRIQIGTNGTAEAVTDVAITAPFDVAVTATYPSSTSVMFSGNLAVGDGNGVTYREAGLVFHNAPVPLVARRTFDAIVKSAAFSWALSWTLSW